MSTSNDAALLNPVAEEVYAKYGSPVEAGSLAEYHTKVLCNKPDWTEFPSTKPIASLLKLLDVPPVESASKTKFVILGNLEIFDACVTALQVPEDGPAQWILALFYELLREDSSCYAIFDQGLKRVKLCDILMKLLTRQPATDQYFVDKAMWLLSSLMCHSPSFFSNEQIVALVGLCLSGSTQCSELGALDTITNLLKSGTWRALVFSQRGVREKIFEVDQANAASPILYKVVFAIWMLSFDKKIAGSDLKTAKVVKVVKEIMLQSRAEKVIRLCLTALRNLLNIEALCEDIVEENVHEVVSCLEFEKWRDAELYDEIRDVTALISHEINNFSNIDRYERELSTGKLNWGYMHTSKFWIDNVLLFDRNDFGAIRSLAELLMSSSTDPTTLAVACHDLGEFVALHPSGKKTISRLNVKQKIMQLMGSADTNHREVRREALLCCQKITLNKWQDVEKASKATK